MASAEITLKISVRPGWKWPLLLTGAAAHYDVPGASWLFDRLLNVAVKTEVVS